MALEDLNTPSSSHWNIIRPWSPRFTLSIREITSVSATFILSSTLSANDYEQQLSSSSGSDDDDNVSAYEHVVSDALSRGLSVTVNGAPWKRVLVRMDDDGDEAIIILYGLIPGRQYDVELGVVSGDGEEIVHGQMVTQPKANDQLQTMPGADPDATGDSPMVPSSALPDASSPPVSTSPSSYTPTLDDHASHLRQQLTQLNAEHALLTAQLKTSRRDSQKADASLRSEIEALRRASEKSAAGEQRSRQRTLALQEAVKQARAAALEAEDSATETEKVLPALRERKHSAERAHADAQRELRRAEEERDDALRADRKRVSDLQAELATLSARLEKLSTKRDKLRNETLQGLERDVERVGREVELVERDANAFEVVDRGPVAFDLSGGRGVFLSPIGAQRVTGGGYGSAPVYPTHATPPSGSTSTISSPPSSGSTRASPSATFSPAHVPQFPKSPRGDVASSASGSTLLSSRAPPFDPTIGLVSRPGFIRSGAPSPTLTGGPTPATVGDSSAPQIVIGHTPPGTASFASQFAAQQAHSHTHTQSWDASLASGARAAPNAAGRRPPSPVRQASLPTHVPSFVGQRPPAR